MKSSLFNSATLSATRFVKPTIVFVLALFLSSSLSAAVYYWNGSGTYSTAGSWYPNRDGTGTPAGNFTTSGDIFIVQGNGGATTNGTNSSGVGLGTSNQTITSTGWTIATGVTLEIEGGATVTTSTSSGLTIANIIIDGNATNYGTLSTTGSGTISNSGTTTCNGFLSLGNTSNTCSFGTLNITNPASLSASVAATGRNFNVTGNLSIPSGSTLSLTGGSGVVVSGSTTLNGTFNGNNTSNTVNFATLSGTGSLNVSRAFTVTTIASSPFLAASGGTVKYTGLGSNLTLLSSYNNLTVDDNGAGRTYTPATTTVYGNMVLSNNATANVFKLAGNNGLTVNGNLTIGTLATLNTQTFTITVNGNVINNGTISGTTGTLTLAGSGTQTLSGGAAGIYFNTILSNSTSGNISLASNITSNGALSLNSQILNLSSYTLTLGTSSSLFSGSGSGTSFSSSIMLKTDGVSGGVLKNATAALSSYVFPLGIGSNYLPATITTAATSNVTVVPVNGAHSPATTYTPIGQFWKITSSAATTVTPTFGFPDAIVTNSYFGSYYTSSWTTSTINPSGSGPYSITYSGLAFTAAQTVDYTVESNCTAPSISNWSSPTASTSCAGSASTVTINSTSIGSGTYTVTYNLSGANTATGSTATLTMGASSGTFSTSNLSSNGATTVTITTITSGVCTTTVSSSNTASITVNQPVNIGTNPSGATASIGGVATTMSVGSVTGTSLTYQWVRSATSGGSYSAVVNGTPTGVTYSGATSTTLSITAGATATTGTNNYYQCVVSGASPCSAATSSFASLTIQAAGLSTPPTLAATASQTVDNDFVITYSDNTDWNGKVTGITVDGGSVLSGSTFYTTPASGSISLKTGAITALQTAGSHTIVVSATGYSNATIIQTNITGVPAQLAIKTALVTPATNGAVFATQPAVFINDKYGNLTNSTATVTPTVTSGQTWLLGGAQTSGVAATAGTATFTNLTAGSTGLGLYSGATITFTCGAFTTVASATFTIPAIVSNATDYFRSNGTGGGVWATAGTWQGSRDNIIWFTATAAPTASAVAINVQSGDVVTIASAVTIGTASTNLVAATVAGELDVNASGTLTIASGSSLTVTGTLVNLNASTTAIVTTGTLSFGSSGVYTLNIGTSGTPATTGQIPTATWNAASTINLNGYYGSINLTTTASSTYGNINVNGIVSGSMVLLPTSYQNIAGNLTITPAGAYGTSGQLQLISSGGTNYLTIGGNYVQQGGVVLQNPSSGTTTCRPMVVLGNFTMDASAGNGNPSFKVNSGTSVGNLIVFGNVSLTNATFSNTSSTGGISNVYFAGSSQTFTTSGTNSFTAGGGSLNWYVNSGTNLNLGTNVLGGTTFNTNGAYTYSSFTGTTSTLTTATNSVTNNTLITAASSTTGLQPGMTISGTGIPANTVIVSVNVVGTSIIQISKPATATNTGVTFTVSSAATSTVQSAHLSGLNGNITTTGTNNLDAGTNYVFNASTGAQVTGALLTAANNLTISNSSGVSLSANTTVSGTLTLTSGNLTLGANNLLLSNTVGGTPSASKHIVTSGAGYVQNTYSTGSYTFPVGYDASNYNPVQITNNAAASQAYTVRAVTTASVLALTNSLKASWSIGGITQSSSAISFPWNSSNDVTATAPTSGIVFYSNGTSSWASPGGSTSGSSPNYNSSVSGIAASSTANYWTVAPCTNAGTSNPSNASACSSGSAATMSVTGTGTALTYQWQYATTSSGSYSNVVDGTPTGVTYGGSGTAATLSATAGSTSIAGNSFYKCAVSAACGSAATSTAAQLTISKAIVIGTNPSATSAAINGSAATMTVSVTGTTPTYQWVRASSAGGTYANVVDGTPTGVTYSGSSSATLSITADATATTGTNNYYKCIVSGASPCGSATSTNAALTINGAAGLTPPTLSATANQSVDNDLSITYPNNTNWNGNVNGITVDGGSTLTGSTYYTTPSAGSVNIHTSAIAELQTPGSHTIVITAATYNDATLVTTNSAGAATQLTIGSIPGSQTAGSTFSVTVTALDQYGNTSNSSAAVSLASSGSGTIAGNTGNLSGGTLTLNSVTYTKAQTVTFTASSTGITSSSASNSVTFGAGTATKLVLATIASPQTVSTSFSITVTAQDAYGNNATSAAAVTLAASGSGTITGNTGSLVSGTLTLSSVKYTKAESVTFTASASGLTTSTASNAVVFNAGPATKLSITTIATQSVGVGFGVVVTATDANGNPANVSSNSLITLTQASGTASNLAGTLTGTITSGTSSVTISGVVYNKVENTSITATQTNGSPTLTAITSNIFTVSILTYYSKTSGTMNWTDATWGLSAAGPFNQTITSSGLDNVVIQSGGTVNLNTNYTTSTGTIIVTGILNITAGNKLTSGAAFTVSASTGVLNIANGVSSVATSAGSTNGTLEITAGTFTVNGALAVNGYFKNSDATAIVYGGSASISFENYSVCELNNTSITSVPTATWNANATLLFSAISSSSGNVFLANNIHYGNVTVNSSGSFYLSGSGNTNPNIFIDGNLSILSTGAGTLKMFSTSGTATRSLTILGDFTSNASGFTLQFDNSTPTGLTTMSVGGNISGALFNNTTGASPTTSTLSLTGTGKTISTTCGFAKWAVKIASGASYTLSANLALNTSSPYATFQNDGILDCSTFVISGGSNVAALFTLSSGATLKTANTGGLSSTILTFGTKTLNPAANYIFNGSLAQVTGALLTAANNLTINNSAGVTLSAATNVNGILNLNGGTLATGANTLTISGTIAYTSGGIDASNASGTLVFAKSGTTTLSAGIISGNINNLTINSGVVLNTVAALNVNKAFTNNGSISGVSTINLVGSTAQTIVGTGNLAKLSLNNSNGATVSSGSQSITGLLTVTSGNLNAGTKGLILKSTSITNTALVDQVGGSITGTVQVERYIPWGFRAYRDIAPSVYNAGSIYNNWQENGTSPSGYGIFITGPTAYSGSSNAGTTDASGFDKTASSSTNTQDYTYANGSWTALLNTSTTLDPFTGYRLLIRGDRSSNLYTTPIINTQAGLTMYNSTTLRATGSLVYGTVTYTTSGVSGKANGATVNSTSTLLSTASNGFSLIANPYVSPVSWTAVYTASGGAASSNLNGSYWYLDPTSSATGKYIAYNALTGPVSVNGLAGSYTNTGTVPTGTDYIQPGQAFFVQNATSGTPNVVFTEACKQASTANLKSIFGATQLSKIYLSLMKQSATTKTFDKVDGAAVAFRPDFGNKAYGSQDAIKFSGANDNLAISDKGKNLSIDGRLPATASDAIPLAITKPSATAYQLSVDASNYISNGFEPILYDAFKNTTKALGTGTTTINFTVDANNAASFGNRFTILFTPSALPVNSIVASASLSNKIATISWKTAGEKNVVRYEVEKSADAKLFTTIGQSTAKNTATASYTTTDNSVTATTYYRIKAVSTTGAISYSNVAKLSTDNRLPSYSLYPNPLKGGNIVTVGLGNVVAGKYTVSIYNALAQKVSEQTISHAGGSATHAISINNALAAGAYSVTISEAGSKQLVHQNSLIVEN